MNKQKARYGVLELVSVIDNTATLRCLVHPDKPPMKLTLDQLQSGANRCCVCVTDYLNTKKNQIDHTGKSYGGYVAIRRAGLSTGADKIRYIHRHNKSERLPDVPNTYNRNVFWECFCRFCHTERKIRSDHLKEGELPKCKCQKEPK